MTRCKACDARMTDADWQVHDCPANPEPIPGESWIAYKARSSKVIAKYRAAHDLPPVKE